MRYKNLNLITPVHLGIVERSYGSLIDGCVMI